MTKTDRIISADSHVNPPKDLWTKGVPAAFKDRAPRVESTPDGDFWIVDSQVTGAVGLDASAGLKPEQFRPMGMSYKEIAAELFISHRTVQNHVQNTLGKLQLHNRVELVRFAIARGLETPEP